MENNEKNAPGKTWETPEIVDLDVRNTNAKTTPSQNEGIYENSTNS